MPIYEYRCGPCGKISSFFTRSINSPLNPVCDHCQSQDLQRRMSSFSQGKTTQSVQENSSAAGGNALDYYRDPRNIGRHVEDSFSRHGVEMPDSVRETINSAREGHLPKQIDTDI